MSMTPDRLTSSEPASAAELLGIAQHACHRLAMAPDSEVSQETRERAGQAQRMLAGMAERAARPGLELDTYRQARELLTGKLGVPYEAAVRLLEHAREQGWVVSVNNPGGQIAAMFDRREGYHVFREVTLADRAEAAEVTGGRPGPV